MTLRRRLLPFTVHPIRLAVATLFGLTPGAASYAQDVPPPPESSTVAAAAESDPAAEGIEEIVVTATRRKAGVQDIPINITAVTGEVIREQQLENLADLVRVVPGLFLVDQGGRDTNLLTVRGLNVSTLGASEGVPTDGGGVVAQYIGDVPLFIDLYLKDIERVEALLGPQGTLYGAGTLGGAIRYLPARPKFNEKSLAFEGGSYAVSHSEDYGFEGQVVGNLPLNERLAVRGLFGVSDEPGFIDYGFLVREPGVSNPQPDFSNAADVAANLRSQADVNDQQTTYGRAAVRYAPTDKLEGTLSYHYQKQEAGGRTVNNADSFDTGRHEAALRYLEPNDRRYQLGTLELQMDFGLATLTSASGYSDFDSVGQRDQTDLLLNFEYGYEDFPSFAAFTQEIAEEQRFSQELRLVSAGEGPLSWIVGAFYNDFDVEATSAEFVPGIPEFFGVDRPDNLEYFQATFQQTKEKALFGEIGYEFFERLTLTIGGRYFKFEDDQRVGFALPLVDGSAPDEIAPVFDEVSVSDKDSIFKANLAFEFTDELLGYATLSEGYRAGGSNALAPCADFPPDQQTACALPNERLIQSDKTLNHEIGLHSRWLGGRLIANGALYYIRWDDIQVDGTSVNGNIPITVNAAEASSQGIELSLQALIGERWSASANYSYNKAELTQDAPNVVSDDTTPPFDDDGDPNTPDVIDPLGGGFDGDRLPGTPEQQLRVSLGFAQPLSNGWKFKADYGISAQSDVYTRVGLRNDGEALGGYAIQDAALGLDAGVWTVKLYAKNLFDKFAETGVRSSRDPAFRRAVGDSDGDGVGDRFDLRGYYHSVLDPMRVGVNFTYRFDY